MSTDGITVFCYHLFVGFTVCLALSFFWAQKVATQATLVRDYTGNVVTTFKVDRREFGRTWVLFTVGATAIWLVILILWETRKGLLNAGILG